MVWHGLKETKLSAGLSLWRALAPPGSLSKFQPKAPVCVYGIV